MNVYPFVEAEVHQPKTTGGIANVSVKADQGQLRCSGRHDLSRRCRADLAGGLHHEYEWAA